MTEKAIQVAVVVLPDRNTLWFIDEFDAEYIGKCVASGREGLAPETLKKYDESGCSTGVVHIYMLREDYDKLHASNVIDWPER